MIIDNNTTLLQYFPNVFDSAEGEKDLYEKIYFDIRLSEQWVQDTVTGYEVYSSLEAEEIPSALHSYVGAIISAHALLLALPKLDLFLTPNGFGVVSNQNIVPASKERIDRLLSNLTTSRDHYIDLAVRSLHGIASWQYTEAYFFWTSTLFPSLSSFFPAGKISYTDFVALLPKIKELELFLSEHYISSDQMEIFRQYLTGFYQTNNEDSGLFNKVISIIRNYILQSIKLGHSSEMPLLSAVDIMKDNPSSFSAFIESDLYEIFISEPFKNTKESHGYWF